jgi:hypothetical protein
MIGRDRVVVLQDGFGTLLLHFSCVHLISDDAQVCVAPRNGGAALRLRLAEESAALQNSIEGGKSTPIADLTINEVAPSSFSFSCICLCSWPSPFHPAIGCYGFLFP